VLSNATLILRRHIFFSDAYCSVRLCALIWEKITRELIMKKTILSLLFAASLLPGVSQAKSFQDTELLNFTASSALASFQFFWNDLVSTNARRGWTNETDGRYSLTLTNSFTNEVLFDRNNLGSVVTGDVPGKISGSFFKSFNVASGSNYTLSFTGKWNGPNGGNWTNSVPSVSISPVPEPSTVAMMLAGLGVLGAIARRRSKTA
jgi:PEP-CTERM motif